MPPQQPPGARPAEDGLSEYEYIDLTKSPEPTPSPRPQHYPPPPRQHLARRFTSGPRNMESCQPGPAAPVPHNIHIDQLRRIIDTSDARSVRSVLMNLCRLSPALSGAVARGLAPQSSYAQQTITAYRNKNAASGSRPGPSREVQTPTSTAKKAPHATPRSQGPVKSESQVITLSDDEEDLAEFKFEWDGEPHVASAGPLSSSSNTAPVKSENLVPSFSDLPVRPAAHAARVSPRPAVVKSEPRVISEPKVKSEPTSTSRERTCRNCNQVIEDEAERCRYHPGQRRMYETSGGGRIWMYSCCRRSINTPGCCMSTHDAVSAGRAPSSSAREPKKPRLV